MQLLTSNTIISFHEPFKKKFNFDDYNSIERPTLFFGIYKESDRRTIQYHRGIKLVWFAGSDSLMIKDTSFLEGATVIAESSWIRQDLDKLKIPHENISFLMDKIYNWLPVDLGKSLYWYSANSTKYGKQYLPAVRKAFPDLNIITNDNKSFPRERMPDIYGHCFAAVRAVEHDGFSQTVAEMALMGRMSIWNMKTPFSVPFEGENGLIEAIRTLRQGYNPFLTAKRARGYFIENETKWANLVLRLCGTSEVDATGIFEETDKKCGSIFRIQRKSDIEKIGGLGDQQFERKWFAEQMRGLGKKMLVTSKNSGFVATEFKNVDKRKGYAEGINFRTHDKTTS